jgi:hypothetical protein
MATPRSSRPVGGTVTRVDDRTGQVSVRVAVLDRVFTLQWGDVVLLP